MSKRERKELVILRNKMERISEHTKGEVDKSPSNCFGISIRIRLKRIKEIVEEKV